MFSKAVAAQEKREYLNAASDFLACLTRKKPPLTKTAPKGKK